MSAIVPNEFFAENVTFTEPKKRKSKDGKSTFIQGYMLYNESLRYWESPWLRAPFGLKAFEAKEGDSNSYSLNISARAVDPHDQEAVDKWFDQWQQVDKLFTDHAIQYSKTIFGKQYSADQRAVVEVLQSRVVKEGEEDENGVPYPRRLAPKIQRDYDDPNKPNLTVYTDSQEDLGVHTFADLENLLPKGARVRLILRPKLWFISGKCGISMQVVQLQVQPTSVKKLAGFAFSGAAPPPVSKDEQEFPDSDAEGVDAEGVEGAEGEDIEDIEDAGEDAAEDAEQEEVEDDE